MVVKLQRVSRLQRGQAFHQFARQRQHHGVRRQLDVSGVADGSHTRRVRLPSAKGQPGAVAGPFQRQFPASAAAGGSPESRRVDLRLAISPRLVQTARSFSADWPRHLQMGNHPRRVGNTLRVHPETIPAGRGAHISPLDDLQSARGSGELLCPADKNPRSPPPPEVPNAGSQSGHLGGQRFAKTGRRPASHARSRIQSPRCAESAPHESTTAPPPPGNSCS